MKYSQITKLATSFVFSLSLAACLDGGSDGNSSPATGSTGDTIGGGGSTGSGGNAGAAAFANRVTRVDYDYDNNGTVDATDAISYDANGRVNLTTYLYSDDGTPDILNLRDSGTIEESNSFAYDSDGNVTSFVVDRQWVRIETNSSYDAAGLLTRVDFQLFNSAGAQTTSLFWTFSYTGQQLDTVNSFIGPGNLLANTLDFTYAANGLLETSVLASDSLNATTTFTWRPDGQLDTLDTQSDNGASSTAALVYDAAGLQQTRIWRNAGQGFGYSEILERNYIRSVSYDAQNRPSTVSYDQDSDGSVDATVTFTWETAPCIPATLWAPNGFPNFVRDAARPFVPGTGFFVTENCAP
ncbi:MAG TPA: hypothetical protein ENJ80_08200 [Gammaproteobacteria bacterium]|nr:hypothetical protein [Gammaproteobacteria bacterium]